MFKQRSRAVPVLCFWGPSCAPFPSRCVQPACILWGTSFSGGTASMKRLVLAIVAAALTVGVFLGSGDAAGSFNQKLSADQQILHALNRLTFGPRPGDVEEVRRIGLTKWIEL